VGEQTTTWTKRSEVENKRSGIKIVQVLSPGKKKERKKKAELEKKEASGFFSSIYVGRE
jgi:hypothetical protein